MQEVKELRVDRIGGVEGLFAFSDQGGPLAWTALRLLGCRRLNKDVRNFMLGEKIGFYVSMGYALTPSAIDYLRNKLEIEYMYVPDGCDGDYDPIRL